MVESLTLPHLSGEHRRKGLRFDSLTECARDASLTVRRRRLDRQQTQACRATRGRTRTSWPSGLSPRPTA